MIETDFHARVIQGCFLASFEVEIHWSWLKETILDFPLLAIRYHQAVQMSCPFWDADTKRYVDADLEFTET